MRLFPSERERQRSDTRTVLFFFKAIALLTVAFVVVLILHRLLGW
jgi:predicted nucleic acid-binding Zn ribbon protein